MTRLYGPAILAFRLGMRSVPPTLPFLGRRLDINKV